jgi:hypothetical protein
MSKKISKFQGLFVWSIGYSYGSMGSRFSRSLTVVTEERSFADAQAKAEKWVEQSEYDDDMEITIDKLECEGTVDA